MDVLLSNPTVTVERCEEIEVSVVMPCLNEARTVGICVRKARQTLDELCISGEVLVADNGSTDGSVAIARDAGARVVPIAARGYGSALRGGIRAAQGRYIIMGDADDSYDFTQLKPFIERLRQGDELVMGNRFKGGVRPGAMPPLHYYFGNPVMTGLVNLFFRTPIGDVQCGLRGFRKDAYERMGLATPGMEFASEMVAKASLKGLKITEVPVVLHPDGRGRAPHMRSFRDGWRNLRFLLLLCPMWLYMIPSCLLLLGGLGLMIWLTPGTRRITPTIGLDVHSMLLGALMTMIGVQTLWLWVFAKVYGSACGILPSDAFARQVSRFFSLERGLVVGAAAFVGGLALNVWLSVTWVEQEMGPLDIPHTMRIALWGFILMVLGVQTAYGSFFLSMLGMPRATVERHEAA